MRKTAEEPQYVRHTGGAAWGVGVLVATGHLQRTYLFEDGERRTFKEAFCEKFIVPAEAPVEENRQRLTRGLVAGGIATPKAINLELEAQIRARLTEPGPYLVYADWLQQRGDPRGDLIAMHAQLANTPGDTKLAKSIAQFLDANGSYLLPPALDELLRTPKRAGDETFRCSATWRMGFLDRVRIAHKKTTKLDVVALVADVLRHPSSVFLRALAFGPLGAPAETSYIEIIRELTKGTIPQTIEEIELGDFAPDVDLAFVRSGSLNPLLSAAPALRRLVVRAGTVRFDSAVKHAALRELAIVASEITTPNLTRLFAAKLPELSSLDLTCAGLAIVGELRGLVMTKTLPKLRHLALRHVAEPDIVRTVIETSPLGAQLASTALDVPRYLGLVREPDVIERAPDARSLTAARPLARPAKWNQLGLDDGRVWGEYEGRAPYSVHARIDLSAAGCTCGSTKDPCKHVLALLLIASTAYVFEERRIPPAYLRSGTERPRYGSSWE